MILSSRRQRRVLQETLDELRRSDPYVVAGFATFTRLTESEPMPGLERVGRSFFRRVIRGRWRAHQRLGAAAAQAGDRRPW